MFSVDKNPYRLAIVGGVLISLIPALIINLIAASFPSTQPEKLKIVSDFFSEGIGLEQLIFFAIVILFIPPVEEYIFRGLLWSLFEWVVKSPKLTWVGISLLFALFHMEPLHVIGLLPISFFIGWLRLKTGNLSASILAHMSNNAVGCLLMSL